MHNNHYRMNDWLRWCCLQTKQKQQQNKSRKSREITSSAYFPDCIRFTPSTVMCYLFFFCFVQCCSCTAVLHQVIISWNSELRLSNKSGFCQLIFISYRFIDFWRFYCNFITIVIILCDTHLVNIILEIRFILLEFLMGSNEISLIVLLLPKKGGNGDIIFRNFTDNEPSKTKYKKRKHMFYMLCRW